MRRQIFILLLALLLPAAPLPAEEAEPDAGQGAWLGVYLRDADDGGVELLAVVPNGPAFKAGLSAGDVLLEFRGRRVIDMASIERLLRASQSGQRVPFVAIRDGKAIERSLHLVGRPAGKLPFPLAAAPKAEAPTRFNVRRPRTGWVTVDVTPDLRRHFGAPPDRGVLVSGLNDGGQAGEIGILVGDIITQIDDAPAQSARQVELAVSRDRSEPLTLRVVRDGRVERFELPPNRVAEPAPPRPPRPVVASDAQLEQAIRSEMKRVRRRLQELESQLEVLRQRAPESR